MLFEADPPAELSRPPEGVRAPQQPPGGWNVALLLMRSQTFSQTFVQLFAIGEVSSQLLCGTMQTPTGAAVQEDV